MTMSTGRIHKVKMYRVSMRWTRGCARTIELMPAAVSAASRNAMSQLPAAVKLASEPSAENSICALGKSRKRDNVKPINTKLVSKLKRSKGTNRLGMGED